MFCPKCGKEIEDDAVVCVHCGRSLKQQPEERAEYQTSKAGIGVVMGLFLGLIGLIIGICMYPEQTIARKTFVKAWLITFLAEIAVVVVLYVIIFAVAFSAI